MSKYLSIAEIAELADIPNSSCRRYLADFEAFFMVKGGSRVKKYEATAVDILKRIKQLYDDGMGTTEIHSVLVNEFPLVVDGEKLERKEEAAAHVPGLATSEDIEGIKQAFRDEFMNMKNELREEIKQEFQNVLEEKMQHFQRDAELRRITQTTKEKTIEEVAAAKEKKGFWARLFRSE